MTEQQQRGRRIHLTRGEQRVSTDTEVVLTTILGSCVAACIRDPLAGIGGMNHFLLPGGDGFKHGVHAMELLMNALLTRGARRERLEAKLFGGARMMEGLTDVGELNASFAERFLATESVKLVGGSLRGQRGRTLQYWPVTGRARQLELPERQAKVFRAEARPAEPVPCGSIEMF